MKLLTTILFITLTLIRGYHPTGTTYYVKVSGGTGSGLDDANAWSYAKLNATSLSSGDVVKFNKGDVFYGALTARAGVTYDAYGSGVAPIISGFTALSSWTNLGSNIWSHSLSAGSVETMVTVGGVLIGPGRFPNTGWLNIVTGGSSSLTTSTGSPSTYNGGNIVIKKREWIIDKAPITSVSGSTVNFTNPDGFPALGPEAGPSYWGFYFTDHLATLDQQNEWYYTSGTLKMYSTSDPGALNVRAASVATLVSMSSKDNVTFQNLTFEGSTDHLIAISGGTGDVINNCTIQFAGKNAISADFGTSLTVSNCSINNANYSGIDAILGSYQYITGNTITNIGLQTSLCQGSNKANHAIWVNGTYNRVANNTIGYTGYVGIDISGNYDTVKNNYVHHHCQTSADGGGIYMSDETAGVGRSIEHNVSVFGLGARDGTPYSGYDNAMGLYLDESTAGVSIINNFSAYNNGGGLYLHKAHDCVITGNTFYGNTLRQFYAAEDGPLDTKIRNIVFTNNVLHSLTSSDYLYMFYAVGSVDTMFSRINQNILSRPSSSSAVIRKVIDYGATTDYSLATWQASAPAYDPFSTGTPSDFASGSPDVYTATEASSTVPLAGVYKSLRGTNYTIGTTVLQPWTGEVVIKTADFVPYTTQTTRLPGRRYRF